MTVLTRPAESVAPLRVRELLAPAEPAWTAFVSAHPGATLYHTLPWRDFIVDVFGHEPRYLVAHQDERVAGVLPLFLVSFPLLGTKLVSMPYDIGSGGPLAESDAAETALVVAARELAIGLGVGYLELRCAATRPAIEALGLVRTEPVLISEMRLDAGDPWIGVSADNRQSIRKAAKRGVTVREADRIEDYQDFYRIYLGAFRAFGTPPYGTRYFPMLWTRLGADRSARLLVAEIGGRAVGGLVLFAWQRNLVSKFAACRPEAVPARAYAALYGAAIDAGLAGGFARLSWGTSAPHQTGLIEFKERWGAITFPAVLYDLPVRGRPPSLAAYYDEGGLARRVWRRLPLPLTARLGGVLNRWFC